MTGTFPSSLAYDAKTGVMTALGSVGRSPVYYVRSTGNNPAFASWPENALATWVLHALDSAMPTSSARRSRAARHGP